MTKTLSEQSPREIDESLEALSIDKARAESLVDVVWERIHRAAADTKVWINKRQYWKLTNDRALIALVNQIDHGKADSTLISQLKAARKVVADLNEQIELRNEVFVARGGWSRFFIVNNTNGHIHSHTSCSTCYATTSFGWTPQLSGKTEAEAVAELGEILCSICFPSAPIRWTTGVSKAAQVAKEEKAAKRAVANARFMTREDMGGHRFNYSSEFKTQRAAQIALVDHLSWSHDRADLRDEVGIQLVTEALLAAGVTQAEIDAKVAAKIARDKKEGDKHCKALGMVQASDGTWSFAR